MKTMTKKTTGWLVMAAALAIGMTACSSADSIAEEPVQQPENPAKKTYTMTVTASKGGDDSALARAMAEAGLTGGDATTRALSLSSDGKTLDATWAAGERVTVYNETKYVDLEGTLTAQTSGASTTLTGTLSGTIDVGDELSLFFHGDALLGVQDGTLQYIADNLDFDRATVTVKSIDVDGNITINEPAAVFDDKVTSIVRFTLVDKADPTKRLKPTSLSIRTQYKFTGQSSYIPIAYTLTGLTDATYTANAYAEDNGDGVLYASFHGADFNDFHMTATMPDGDTYEYVRSAVEFEVGKFYSITVKMTRQPRTYDLSEASGNITLKDGDELTGRPAGSYNISIADGATVTLNEAYISPEEYVEWDWLGITCLGNATIVLSGDNVVWSTVYEKPAIQAGPEGTTLTITGTGTLTAGSDGDGAAIGSGSEGTCGDIIITGGTVTAMCSNIGAAIGSSQGGSCGDIIITGGTVTATNYGTDAGIGSSQGGYCGDIIITGGTVTATNYGSGAGIGSGNGGNCGKIIISGGSVTATGGRYAAGIGNAQGGSCEAIYITNGVTRVEADNFDKDDDWHSRYPSIGLPISEVRIGCWYDTESGVYEDGTVYWLNGYENEGEDYLNQHPLIYEP